MQDTSHELEKREPPKKPGDHLAGLTLEGGWTVVRKEQRPRGHTGGGFSVGYLVEDQDGRKAHMKAIDITDVIHSCESSGQPDMLKNVTEQFIFERDLLKMCLRMSRVVTMLDSGVIPAGTVPDTAALPVFYLICEKADTDARIQATTAERLSLVLIFQTLHDVFVGMSQLHRALIAHQDLKPSNVLQFNDRHGVRSKIGDVGRSSCYSVDGPILLGDLTILGDLGYAPPELLYGEISSDWRQRRLGADVYLAGSLIVFFFTGRSMTSFLHDRLIPEHRWQPPLPGNDDEAENYWHGTYEGVLDFVRNAFDLALDGFRINLESDLLAPNKGRPVRRKTVEEVILAVRYMCEPDPDLRGHPRERRLNPYNLQRYVSMFERLTAEARMGRI